MLKKAIQAIKTVSARYKHSEVLVILEGGDDAERLNSLINEAFDGKFTYETINLDRFIEGEAEIKGFICSECFETERTFKTLRGLKTHFRIKHQGVPFPKTPMKVTTKVSFKDRLDNLKKYLEDNPKKVLILQRSDDSTFIEGQKDIRPLKYIVEEE